MAEKNTEASAPAEPAKAAAGPPLDIKALILPALYSLTLLGTLGFLYYSKLMFKRTPITEESERKRLAELHSEPPPPSTSVLVTFPPITLNIASNPMQPEAADNTSQQIRGKLHYVSIGFALEIRDESFNALVESARPLIMDKLILLLGKKQFHQLNNVQGRYVLHSQLIDVANQEIALIATSEEASHGGSESDAARAAAIKDGVIINLFFTHFIVQ